MARRPFFLRVSMLVGAGRKHTFRKMCVFGLAAPFSPLKSLRVPRPLRSWPSDPGLLEASFPSGPSLRPKSYRGAPVRAVRFRPEPFQIPSDGRGAGAADKWLAGGADKWLRRCRGQMVSGGADKWLGRCRGQMVSGGADKWLRWCRGQMVSRLEGLTVPW